MTSRQSEPPVVVLGGISLVRTLGMAGIRAIVATSKEEEPALASRYCTMSVRIPRLDSGTPAADALVALGGRLSTEYGRRVPLMYGSDDAIELINANRERLERYYLLLLNDPEVAAALFAKDRFQAFALDRGLPVPPALAWDDASARSLRRFEGAVVVKPSEKVDWHNSALCRDLFDGDGKALVFPSGAAAAEHAGVAKHHHSLTFQQYIPGGHGELWSYHGFADEHGQVLLGFTGRKLRTFPAVNGESAFIEIAHDEELEAVGRDVVRRCPLKGPFKMDFKRDSQTGRWYLLEINARCTLWHYLGACNGVNLMEAAYDYLMTGSKPLPVKAKARYRWLAFDYDFKAYREMARAGEITFVAWIGSILGSRKIYNVFSWRDPGPWAHDTFGRIFRRMTRGPRRVATRFRQWRATAS